MRENFHELFYPTLVSQSHHILFYPTFLHRNIHKKTFHSICFLWHQRKTGDWKNYRCTSISIPFGELATCLGDVAYCDELVDNLDNANNASGKFGGVAGVLAGAHIWKKEGTCTNDSHSYTTKYIILWLQILSFLIGWRPL